MELTLILSPPSWQHPCKVYDQRRSVGKIKFTRNREMLNGAFCHNLKQCFKSWIFFKRVRLIVHFSTI